MTLNRYFNQALFVYKKLALSDLSEKLYMLKSNVSDLEYGGRGLKNNTVLNGILTFGAKCAV